jgi:hypothetical protein
MARTLTLKPDIALGAVVRTVDKIRDFGNSLGYE